MSSDRWRRQSLHRLAGPWQLQPTPVEAPESNSLLPAGDNIDGGTPTVNLKPTTVLAVLSLASV